MQLLPVIIILLSVLFLKKIFFVVDNIDSTSQSQLELMAPAYKEVITKLSASETAAEAPPEKEGAQEEGKKASESDAEDVKQCLTQPVLYSAVELELLQNLTARRHEIEERDAALSEKEKLVRVAEGRVEEKLAALKALEATVNELIEQYKEKGDDQINSLVRIYQNMKPKDAAKIFDELDMDILLQVIGKMKEASSAPIIANMNPEKAKELTTLLARQKTLSEL